MICPAKDCLNGCGGARADCPARRAAARPSSYTPEIAAKICERLEEGESLRSICEDQDMPPRRTVRRWVAEDHDGFAARYAHARDAGLEELAEELLEIADDGRNDWMEKERPDGSTFEAVNHEHIQRSRLRADTRKWLLSKRLPRTYGDKITQEHTGPGGGPVRLTWGDGSE